MRIMITGASGFIGRYLVERLAPIHEVYALVRQPPATPHPARASSDLRVAGVHASCWTIFKYFNDREIRRQITGRRNSPLP